MAQQQLLLLIAGIVFIAIAVTLTLFIIEGNTEENIKNEIVTHLSLIGADAQQWFSRPAALKGGGGAFNRAGGADSSYKIPQTLIYTQNSNYIIDSINDSLLIIFGVPDSSYNYNWKVKTTITPLTLKSQYLFK